MSVEWRDVPEFEGYYRISCDGQVESLPRLVPMPLGGFRTTRRTILKQHAGTGGYLRVTLYRGHAKLTVKVHRLVARAFLAESYFEGAHVCHGDGCRTNNDVTNLRWGTRSDNVQDCLQHGTHWQIRKTQCPRQHHYSPENTRIVVRRDGRRERQCRTCARAYDELRRSAA